MIAELDKNLNQISQDANKITKVCFFSFNFQDALSHLRMIGPARLLGLMLIEGVENGQVFVDRAQLGDIIVLQRDFPREIERYEEIVSIARQNNIPVILDIDDLLFELPENHPDRQSHVFTWTLLPTYLAMLEVDVVTVSSKSLYDFVHIHNNKVIILPNYLDDQIWRIIPPVRKLQSDQKISIGYMGGLSHQHDIEMLIPVFYNLNCRFPNRLEFRFWGARPPDELLNYPNISWDDQITWNYQDFATYFQTQSADIFVAPLQNNFFNRHKSSIKYLEYSSLGSPGVFSRLDPYSEVITHEVNGFLASTSDEWEDSLVRLIENPDLRYSIARNAQETIQSKWLLSKNASLWRSAYQKAQELKSARTGADSSNQKIIKSIAAQTVSWHRYTKHQFNSQKNRIVELEDLAAHQGVTIAGITSSKTWKLALSLRHLREFLAPPYSKRTKILDSILGIPSSKNNTTEE